MLIEYIEAGLESATFTPIHETGEFYGQIVQCKGVWATGKTTDECKQNLREVLESWLFVRIKKGLEIPVLKGKAIKPLVQVDYDQAQAIEMA